MPCITRISGERQAPPVLLLNSLGSTLAMWERQVPALAESFMVIRCDTRGHGESPVPPGPYVIDDLVDDAIALLDNLGISPPETWIERATTVRANGTAAVADTVVSRWLTQSRRTADPQTTQYLRDMIAATPADGYAACCDAVRDMDLRADLAGITAPTLVVSGLDDPSTPPVHLHTIVAGIPGARLVELSDCAHMAPIDQPEAVTSALVEHFSVAGRNG